jgi:hypothetical protein
LNFRNETILHRLAPDFYTGFVSAGVRNILVFANAAASHYMAGHLGRGEDLHVQAELACTRLMINIMRFYSGDGRSGKKCR